MRGDRWERWEPYGGGEESRAVEERRAVRRERGGLNGYYPVRGAEDPPYERKNRLPFLLPLRPAKRTAYRIVSLAAQDANDSGQNHETSA